MPGTVRSQGGGRERSGLGSRGCNRSKGEKASSREEAVVEGAGALPGDTMSGDTKEGQSRDRFPGETASLPRLERYLESGCFKCPEHLGSYLVSPSLSRGRRRLG